MNDDRIDAYDIGQKLGALSAQVENVDDGVKRLTELFFQGQDEQRTVNENHSRIIAGHETNIKSHEIRIRAQEERKSPFVAPVDFVKKYWWAIVAIIGGWMNWRFPGLWDEIFSVFNQIMGASR